MSKIQAELVKATDLSTKRNEDRQDFLERVLKAVDALSDGEFEDLTKAAKDWANAAADAKNKNKDFPDFPDAKSEEPEEKTTRRSSSKDKDEDKATTGTKEVDPNEVDVDMAVKVITKRGKEFSGVVVEATKKLLAIKLGDGSEEEFDWDRLDKIYTLSETKGGKSDGPAEAQEGDKVKVITKRGKEVTGKLLKLTKDDVVVIDADGEEHEFDPERIEAIEVLAAEEKTSRRGAAKDEPEEKTTTRRGAGKAEEKDEGKNTRVTNDGVSIGQRIKELIADNLDGKVEDIAKALKKEGLEFKENTLKLNYADAHKFIDVLRAKKLLK